METEDTTTLERFADRLAQEVATQEVALQNGPTPEVEEAIRRVRMTWAERNSWYLWLGAGVAGGVVLVSLFLKNRS